MFNFNRNGAGNLTDIQAPAIMLEMFSSRAATIRAGSVLPALVVSFSVLVVCVRGQKVNRTDISGQPPEKPQAAATVNLVYDAAQADLYYSEIVVEKTTDNSFFVPCGWENGYFGFQQYDGENKRAFIFAVWNPADETGNYSNEPVETLFTGTRGVVARLKSAGGGVQCMRQFAWKVGETNRFAVLAQVQSNKTAYTAWLFNREEDKWERLATFRAETGARWLRGYYSFVEDFRRDYKSANDTRRARFPNVWIHQDGGAWIPVRKAMFVSSGRKNEAKEAVDAGESEGAFVLATGGAIKDRTKIGSNIVLSGIPFKEREQPDAWFLYDKPKL